MFLSLFVVCSASLMGQFFLVFYIVRDGWLEGRGVAPLAKDLRQRARVHEAFRLYMLTIRLLLTHALLKQM